MSRLSTLSTVREDDAWRVAAVGGAVALALVLSSSILSGNFGDPVAFSISLTPVFIGGTIAGYLAEDEVKRVGKRVALIVAAPIGLWVVVHGIAFLALGDAGPPWFRVAGLGFLAVVTAMLLAFAMVGGMLGAVVGGWLS